MADQKIEIKLVIAEEVSRQLAPLAAEVKAFHANTAQGAERVHASMTRLGGVVRVVHREFSTLSRLTLGGLVGGGVVAGIVAASKALGDMARQGQQLRYQAEALGTTPAFLETMSDGLLALGVDASTAAHDVQSVIGTLRDAETHGNKSSLFKALEHGVGGSGLRLWREIRQQMAGPEGAEGAFKFLISRMQNMAPTGQRAMLKALGISSLAFKDLKEVLPQLHKRMQLPREETQRLAVANANWQIEMGNVGRMLGKEVMPGLEKIMTALSAYLRTENGKKFAKEIGEWASKIGDAVAAWISQGGLQKSMEALGAAVTFLTTAFGEANEVIVGIGTAWKEMIDDLVATDFVQWLKDVAEALDLLDIGLLDKAGELMKNLFGSGKTQGGGEGSPDVWRLDPNGNRIPAKPPDVIPPSLAPQPRFVPQGVPRPDPTSGEGKQKSEQERRADIEIENRERTALLTEMKELTASVGQVVDYFQIGGPEGSADGRSGFGAGVTVPNDLSPGAFQTMFGGGSFGGHYQTVVDTAQKHGIPPSLMASIFGVETGYGKSNAVRSFNNPAGLMGGGFMNRTFQKFESLGEGIDAAGRVQKRIYEGGGRAIAGMGAIYAPTGKGGRPVGNDPNNTNRLWPGLVGGIQSKLTDRGYDPGGLQDAEPSPIIRSLAAEGGGGGGMGGSATVDIDVGGLGKPARNPAELFKPQPLDGAIQMQNVTHQQHNPLSFQ